jgi:SAM-dependent methyltransferase
VFALLSRVIPPAHVEASGTRIRQTRHQMGQEHDSQARYPSMLNFRAALSHPRVYRAFSSIIGADRGRKRLVKDHIKPHLGDKVLDIGCGPADILGYLPGVQYVGFDASERYIANARSRWGTLGTFTCGRVTEATVQHDFFDVVLAIGVLHHLTDDEALKLFEIASSALRPGGRVITVDGAYVDRQSPLARYLLSKDRGQYVRSPESYEALARVSFADIQTSLIHNLILPIPYTHLIMECASKPKR